MNLLDPAAQLAPLKVEGKPVVNGQSLIRATNHWPQQDYEATYHLLPDNHFAVVANERKYDGKLYSRFTADFDPSLPVPTFPKRFKTDYFEDEKLTRSHERFLVSMKVNVPLPANAFVVDFPPGTEVVDITSKPPKIYTVPGKPADPKSPNK